MRKGWKQATLGEVASVNPTCTGVTSDSPFITMSDVSGWGRWASSTSVKGTRGGTRAEGGDVLVARITPCLENGKIALVPYELGAVGGSTEFIVLRGNDDAISEYLYLWASEKSTHSAAISLMFGTTGRQRVSAKDYRSLPISLPPLKEQHRIIGLIRAMDSTIAAATEVAASAETFTQELREQLFTPGPVWNETSLGDHLVKVTNPVSVVPGNAYTEIGVRSHGRGAFIKEPTSGAALGKKRVFYVTPGQLVFNIVFAWEGAVAVLGPETEGMIASHRFPTFVSSIDGGVELLAHFFRTSRGKDLLGLCSPGGAGRNRTLNQKALMTSPVRLPPLDQWNQVVHLLAAATDHAAQCRETESSLRELRSQLLTALISGEHVIPSTYDELMSAAI
jgi:type I restriction enzyme S subunit